MLPSGCGLRVYSEASANFVYEANNFVCLPLYCKDGSAAILNQTTIDFAPRGHVSCPASWLLPIQGVSSSSGLYSMDIAVLGNTFLWSLLVLEFSLAPGVAPCLAPIPLQGECRLPPPILLAAAVGSSWCRRLDLGSKIILHT